MSTQQISVAKKVLPIVETIPYLTKLSTYEPNKAIQKAKTSIAWIEKIKPTTDKEKQLLRMAKMAFEALVTRSEVIMS